MMLTKMIMMMITKIMLLMLNYDYHDADNDEPNDFDDGTDSDNGIYDDDDNDVVNNNNNNDDDDDYDNDYGNDYADGIGEDGNDGDKYFHNHRNYNDYYY